MAEKYRFFDAVQDEHGQYDREYNAQEFTDYFKALVTTGVMKGAGNELAVAANGSNMITTVNTGIAFLLGRYYENDSSLTLTHDTETLGNSRIDRIVIRMDLSTEARYVKAFIKKGVPSTNPVAPTLTQTPNLYEISLAQVKIVGGQTFIATNAVTDERGKDIICPWAGSKILPNFDNATLEQLVNDVETKLVDATITNKGIVQIGSGLKVNNGVVSNAIVDSGNIPLSPWNGWYEEYTAALTIRKIGNVIYGKFHTRPTSTSSSSIIAQLPENYRPSGVVPFDIYGSVNGTEKVFHGFVNSSGMVMVDPTTPINQLSTTTYYDFEFSFLLL